MDKEFSEPVDPTLKHEIKWAIEIGPATLLSKHGPMNREKKATHEKSIVRLQPPPYELFKFQPPPQTQIRCRLSIHQPPPKPPNISPTLSRLQFVSVISNSPVAVYSPISLPINGKRDAAGDDPGALQFHRVSSASVFDAINSLEDKVGLKGLARQPITLIDDRYVEGWSFNRPPAEPPPHSLIDRVSDHWVFSNIGDCTWQLSGRKEAASDDPGDILILPRLMFAFWLALDCSLEDKAYSIGAVMSVDVELKLEGEDSKLADIGCTIQEDGHEDNLMLQLVYHCPRPPDFANRERGLLDDSKVYSCLSKENCLQVQLLHLISPNSWKLRLSFRILVFAKKIEIELWAPSHNIHALADVSIERLRLSMQGLITKDNKTDAKTWMCTMEFHGHSSYYNLEDKVVLKEGGIDSTQIKKVGPYIVYSKRAKKLHVSGGN